MRLPSEEKWTMDNFQYQESTWWDRKTQECVESVPVYTAGTSDVVNSVTLVMVQNLQIKHKTAKPVKFELH